MGESEGLVTTPAESVVAPAPCAPSAPAASQTPTATAVAPAVAVPIASQSRRVRDMREPPPGGERCAGVCPVRIPAPGHSTPGPGSRTASLAWRRLSAAYLSLTSAEPRGPAD